MKRRSLLWITGIVCLLLALPLVISAQTDVTCAEIAPDDADSFYFLGLGDAYFRQASYSLAIVSYTCALELDDTYVPAYANRGYAHAVQRNEPQAIADYNRALELDETYVPAYNNRGLLYTAQGNFGLAINDFSLAVAFDPQFAIGYNNRGIVHAIEGNYDLAIADFQQAIALDPDYAAPHASLGAVYSALAVQSYEDYREIVGEGSRLPAGEADDVISALESNRLTGIFAVWLPLQTPAR